MDTTLDDNSKNAKLFYETSKSLISRFQQTHHVVDVNRAVLLAEQAVRLTPNNHTGLIDRLDQLAIALRARYELLERVDDIDKEIMIEQRTIDLVQNDDAQRLWRLADLGGSLTRRYERLGDIIDLDKAIMYQQQAVDLIPDDHVVKASILTNLGGSLMRKFYRSKVTADIDQAIVFRQRALDITPSDYPGRPLRLMNLGNSLDSRFSHSGNIADLDEAILVHQQASDAAPDNHPGKPTILTNLGGSLTLRFERLGEAIDIDKAILARRSALHLTPKGHARIPFLLMHLGGSLTRRFERLGEITDINEAITLRQKAVDLMPNDHADKPMYLMNLGGSLSRRFLRSGDFPDIDKAILYRQQAIDLTPDGYVDKPLWLMNLGNSLTYRFERSNEIADIDKGVKAHQRAFSLVPDGHPDKPFLLMNLGTSLTRRFQRSREVADIDEAISFRQQALNLVPGDHTLIPSMLMNQGTSLVYRFERLGEITDIDKGILLLQHALSIIDNSDVDRPFLLTNLGNALSLRFERTGYAADIDGAISAHQQALSLTPNRHAARPGFLVNLGRSFELRFYKFRQKDDVLASIVNFKESACSPSGSPTPRFNAAIAWARLSAGHHEIDASLNAYSTLVSLIPRFAWLGNTVHQRFHVTRLISKAVTEAAAFACAFSRSDLALEWLEQGRSVVWGQILHLRTPMDSLALEYPDVHEELQDIARRLELSASERQPEKDSNDVFQSLSLEEAAEQHHLLAERWDSLIAQVRSNPGYQEFLQPKTSSEILSVSRHGTVITINIAQHRCDALIIRQNSSTVEHVHLSSATKDLLLLTNRRFSEIIKSKGMREYESMISESEQSDTLSANDRDTLSRLLCGLYNRYTIQVSAFGTDEESMESVLSILWVAIVKPLLNYLGLCMLKPGAEFPHIIWCATGSLALLPLHAAGDYLNTQNSHERLYNYAVSSYTPTLTALLGAAQERSLDFSGLLAISQPATPGLGSLPGTEREVESIQELLTSNCHRFHLLQHKQATVDSVLNAMDHYSWIHLACHGVQQQKDVTRSAFALYDGPLTLQKISQKSLQSARFAFLSACQTAMGVDDLPDEAVHLGAGMLIAGYQSVIATMWSINDSYAPMVADDVYKELLKDVEIKGGQAAYALHRAIGRLRTVVGEKKFIYWVPFIHLGL